MKETLTRLGLTENESVVYLTLLKLGPSLAGILSRKCGIHRRTIYDILDRLIAKGLIGYIVTNNRKLFEAKSPAQFKEILREQETILEDELPNLLKLYSQEKEHGFTQFFRGKNGLKSVFSDQLMAKEEIMVIGASAQAYETLAHYFPHYDRERQKKNIPVRMIFNNDVKKKNLKIPLAQIKYLPEKLSTPSATNIYDDTVNIIVWGENPLAIVIKNKNIADSYRVYFQLLWQSAKR